MFRLEQDALSKIDLVVACSEMERLKYLEMGARKTIFYPNVYPSMDFEPVEKDQIPSVTIVLREHWGRNAKESLKKILYSLECLGRNVRVYLIGIKQTESPCNVEIIHYAFLTSKAEYLEILSKSWIGINIGIHLSWNL